MMITMISFCQLDRMEREIEREWEGLVLPIQADVLHNELEHRTMFERDREREAKSVNEIEKENARHKTTRQKQP